MRYRQFGRDGKVVSAVSLALTDLPRASAADWTKLIYAALEQGVNMFEIVGKSPAILDGLAEGLSVIDRHMACVSLRVGKGENGATDFSARGMVGAIQATIARTGLDYLDAVILDDPAEDALAPDALAALKGERSSGTARMLGVAGQNPALDYYVAARAFDVLAMPYGLTTGWIERHRLKAAIDLQMAVIGYDFVPCDLPDKVEAAQPKRGFWGVKKDRANPLAGVGTYAFLDNTPGWTLEEICLAFALTEPSLASVQINASQAARLVDLASVAERDLPSGLPSRIEMARFGEGDRRSQARGRA